MKQHSLCQSGNSCLHTNLKGKYQSRLFSDSHWRDTPSSSCCRFRCQCARASGEARLTMSWGRMLARKTRWMIWTTQTNPFQPSFQSIQLLVLPLGCIFLCFAQSLLGRSVGQPSGEHGNGVCATILIRGRQCPRQRGNEIAV